MAGLKNMYQHYGATPFNPIQGKTIMDRHAAFQMQQLTPYCYFCGKEIVNSNQDENGRTVDAEWEMSDSMHYRCYRERNH